MSSVRVTIAGASGRMGQALIRAVAESNDLVLAYALEREGHPGLGSGAGVDAGGVRLTDDPLTALAKSDVVLDFTAPASTLVLADLAAQARIVHVIGTTGISDANLARIRAAARHAVIVKSGNMSLGVNLLAALVREAAKVLPNYDI